MNLESLKQLAEAATPGPWVSFYEGGGDHMIQQASPEELEIGYCHGSCSLSDSPTFETASANAAFIAACNPKVVMAMLEVVRQAKEAYEYQPSPKSHAALGQALSALESL